MSEENGVRLFGSDVSDFDAAAGLLQRLTDIGQGVFSEPVSIEGQTVITATELTAGLGFGFGGGSDNEPHEAGGGSVRMTRSSGGGGGGGGGAMGRPVAAIILTERGVRVEPIVDVTKLGLAFFTMLGSVLIALLRQRKASG
jgi:uncharacterized spore protein YtfJ